MATAPDRDEELRDLKESAAYLQSAFLAIVRTIQRREPLARPRPFDSHRPPLSIPRAAAPWVRPSIEGMPARLSGPVAITHAVSGNELGVRSAFIARTPRRPSHQSVIEYLIGDKWLGRVGLFILLMGVGFLIAHAYDQGWLSPRALVLIAAIAGGVLLALGIVSAVRRAPTLAAIFILSAAGVLDFSVAWGHDAHAMFSHVGALVGFAMIASVTTAFCLYSGPRWATLGVVLGAYVAPIGVAQQDGHAVALILYTFILSFAVLLVGIARRIEALRVIAWVGTASLLSIWQIQHPDGLSWVKALAIVTLVHAVFQADLFQALRRSPPPPHGTLAVVAHLNTLALFGAIVYLLGPTYPRAMGPLAIASAILVWILAGRIKQRDPAHRQLKRALRLDGAILLGCFASLQFSGPWVPIMLCAQAVVTAAFCRRLYGPWPAAYASGMVFAAMAHLIGQDYFQASMTTGWSLLHGFDFTWITVLASVTALAAYLVAACLAAGRTTGPWEKRFAGLLIATSTATLLYLAVDQSDRFHATWWWIAYGLLWSLIAFRFSAGATVALILVIATTVKFVAWDTLAASLDDGWTDLHGVFANRAVLTGALLALLLMISVPAMRRLPTGLARRLNRPFLQRSLGLAAAIVITWTGTFEILRVFTCEDLHARFAQADLALQVALSVFWSGSAIVALVIGLTRFNQSMRIFAMALFGVAGLKVFLLDLAFLETVYRVISCVALGLLMVLASILYHRLASNVVGIAVTR